MRANGIHRNAERFGGRLVGVAIGDQVHHPALGLGQRFVGRTGTVGDPLPPAHALLALGFEPADGGVWEIAAADAGALNRALDGARATGALLVELERASRDLEDVLTEALAAGTA